ncbi:50S ribosomal protein L13 domain protein [Dictyocaulus viviparus]|uniref:50S ribosomal protein L13 domain protein n=1 Tax=Dictyocaulus viviparus TaxID=29172 RepID=A0A0D8XRU8_DICVI|nr:50S ribosomal protein L13 domain protein [Dictyocaulus viviparus]
MYQKWKNKEQSDISNNVSFTSPKNGIEFESSIDDGDRIMAEKILTGGRWISLHGNRSSKVKVGHHHSGIIYGICEIQDCHEAKKAFLSFGNNA